MALLFIKHSDCICRTVQYEQYVTVSFSLRILRKYILLFVLNIIFNADAA